MPGLCPSGLPGIGVELGRTTRMTPKTIGFIGYDGLTALDLVGPSEAFAAAQAAGTAAYRIVIIGLAKKPFTAESGIVFQPQYTLLTAPPLDTVVIPGGAGLRRPEIGPKVSAWLTQRADQIRRIATVCTGIYGVAPTGLLDGRQVTTHWRFARDLAQRFPRLRVDPNPLFLKDGRFYTSAGVTAGIDLALALIEEDCGPKAALEVARELVLYLKRPGGQEQFSEPLHFQIQGSDRFAELAAWIAAHLHADLTVETLAERAALCPRHFRRRFKHSFGSGPAAFVLEMRLGETRRQLAGSRHTIEAIAAAVGFADPDSLRRAFRRRYGVSPSDYRTKFSPPAAAAHSLSA
jgi:transcriptional regulator GlxA family with amidase domain